MTETLRSQNITLDDKEARRLERASTDGKIPRCVFFILFRFTRSCAALRAADLDWIVGPEYSLGRNKQKRYPGGVTTDLGGG